MYITFGTNHFMPNFTETNTVSEAKGPLSTFSYLRQVVRRSDV